METRPRWLTDDGRRCAAPLRVGGGGKLAVEDDVAGLAAGDEKVGAPVGVDVGDLEVVGLLGVAFVDNVAGEGAAAAVFIPEDAHLAEGGEREVGVTVAIQVGGVEGVGVADFGVDGVAFPGGGAEPVEAGAVAVAGDGVGTAVAVDVEDADVGDAGFEGAAGGGPGGAASLWTGRASSLSGQDEQRADLAFLDRQGRDLHRRCRTPTRWIADYRQTIV